MFAGCERIFYIRPQLPKPITGVLVSLLFSFLLPPKYTQWLGIREETLDLIRATNSELS